MPPRKSCAVTESKTSQIETTDTQQQAADLLSAEPVVENNPTGFGALSCKIRSRTTDLIAVAIIVFGGLGVGSQVARWWATDETELAPQDAADVNLTWGDGQAPVTLEFGDRPVKLERQTVKGDRKVAMKRLIARCATVAAETPEIATEMLPAERKLLGLLKRQQPVLEGDGGWSVYQIERPMALVLATHDVPRARRGLKISRASNQTNSQAEQPSRRVVCWGMAQPGPGGVWILFLLQPTGGSAASRPESGEVALPAGCRKIMSLRDASGGALVAFEGEGTAGNWKMWFDDWFADHRWQSAQSWTESSVGWSAAYRPIAEDKSGRIDVSFSALGDGQLSGMISIASPVRETSEGLQP